MTNPDEGGIVRNKTKVACNDTFMHRFVCIEKKQLEILHNYCSE